MQYSGLFWMKSFPCLFEKNSNTNVGLRENQCSKGKIEIKVKQQSMFLMQPYDFEKKLL